MSYCQKVAWKINLNGKNTVQNLIINYLEYPSKDGTKIFHKTHANKLGVKLTFKSVIKD